MSATPGPPPQALTAPNIARLPVGSILHRTHARTFGSAQFNPGLGQPSRFAPFTDAATGVDVPTLYAATSREAAVFETIFHEIDAKARRKSVPLSTLETRAVSTLRTVRALDLVALFTPDLSAWGLRRDELIDTPKSAYRATAAWARAIHQAAPASDGLIWTSRRCAPERCLLLFGDRVDEASLEIEERRDIAEDAALLLELRAFVRRAGITIVV